MYVAPKSDKIWLLNEQRKLYARSWENPDYQFLKLWGLITDRRNLRAAFERISRNRGRRTAGVDGVTVRSVIAKGVEQFVEELRKGLRNGSFKPSPVRRVMVPKSGKIGQFRPLGIPTVKDRTVQAAMKNILEPIFEADFYPCSYGFRPQRGVHMAVEQIRKLLCPTRTNRQTKVKDQFPYQYAIEGDIKGCFDNISHHGLMRRVRRRVGDNKVNRLIVAFLKSGVMEEERIFRSQIGTPQGGILSPLLANIALSTIEERYERYAWPRHTPSSLADPAQVKLRARRNRDHCKSRGKTIFVPIRYADDFIILVGVPRGPEQIERAKQAAHREKKDLAKVLKTTLDLELSVTKTLVSPITSPMRFLGHQIRVQKHPLYGWESKATIPKDRSKRLRQTIKEMFKRNICNIPLRTQLVKLNALLKGWGNFYRYARGAKNVFHDLDRYVWWTIRRWLKKKHRQVGMRKLYTRYGWRTRGGKAIYWHDANVTCFQLQSLRVERFKQWSQSRFQLALTSMESPVHNERCTLGSEEGAPETAG